MVYLKIEVRYDIELPSEKLADAIYRSIIADVKNLPEACVADIYAENKHVILAISCSSISKLRALNNSFIGVLTLLLKVVGDIENVDGKTSRENPATRGSTTIDTVSNTKRSLYQNRG